MRVEGPAEHGRVLELMCKADVFLLPSHGEGFPNSLVEAMAAGMASVVTPVGAVPEMVAGWRRARHSGRRRRGTSQRY